MEIEIERLFNRFKWSGSLLLIVLLFSTTVYADDGPTYQMPDGTIQQYQDGNGNAITRGQYQAKLNRERQQINDFNNRYVTDLRAIDGTERPDGELYKVPKEEFVKFGQANKNLNSQVDRAIKKSKQGRRIVSKAEPKPMKTLVSTEKQK